MLYKNHELHDTTFIDQKYHVCCENTPLALLIKNFEKIFVFVFENIVL